MEASKVRPRNQVTLPAPVMDAAGLAIGDQVAWRFEAGEIRGVKLRATERSESRGKIVLDPETGLAVWSGDVGEDAGAAVLRHREED